MSASKLQILDFVLETENEIELKYKSLLETEVTKIVYDRYGDAGVDVANAYYHEDDEVPVEEECDDCAEKAKRMIESINFASELAESINSEHISKLFSKIKDSKVLTEKIKECFDCIKSFYPEEKLNSSVLTKLFLKFILADKKTNSENGTQTDN